MTTLADMMLGWNGDTQALFLAFLAFLATALLWYALRTVRVVLRGYPASGWGEECENAENLTGRCLRPGGCRDADQCQHTVRIINRASGLVQQEYES